MKKLLCYECHETLKNFLNNNQNYADCSRDNNCLENFVKAIIKIKKVIRKQVKT